MSTQFNLQDQCALIFGGTSGIGKVIALAFAEAGANVVAVSRRQQEVDKTADQIRALGRRTLALSGDVTNRTRVNEIGDAVLAEMGRIDILVNCAGTSTRIPSLAFPESRWDEILNINLKGTWNACQIIGQVMKDGGRGSIINICSLSSFVALYEVTPYCVSKAAVAMLTKCLATEWAQFNIRVNGIAPGVFETPLNTAMINEPGRKASILSRTPMKRFGNVEELAGVALYLASGLSSFTTGEIICVDGGFLAQGIGG